MLGGLWYWLRGLLSQEPVRLAIVRRYCDANGNYVGELYMYGVFAGIGSYRLVGWSLDSLGFDLRALSLKDEPRCLDTRNDFLAPMPARTLRIGSLDPKDNDAVRQKIGQLRRSCIRLIIQNRFVEHVMAKKP